MTTTFVTFNADRVFRFMSQMYCCAYLSNCLDAVGGVGHDDYLTFHEYLSTDEVVDASSNGYRLPLHFKLIDMI
jgi:hypothetical protein